MSVNHLPHIQYYQECVATYDSVSKQVVYVFVEQMPQYSGGQ
ncbi:hypothetical protein M23134_01581 [Microscilla marina ATCC 23134]|uniref:Uncharacterized protein n=1 Tax=Microscilla marina ATCC 23134 TaxID=313606 RepID=A1ZTJ9_MICM2|nr:hypothetical protein M23134_01581 [Microscilla marina ATCC 23134]